jgi:hypothetical protein
MGDFPIMFKGKKESRPAVPFEARLADRAGFEWSNGELRGDRARQPG